MTRETALTIVESGYAALERDDIPGFLELCAPDVEWLYPAPGLLPYGGSWIGRDGVAAFFEAHDAAEEILEFRVEELIAHAGRVVAVGLFRGRALPAGGEWATRFAHVITLRDERWLRLEAFFDTAAALAARRG